MKLPMIVVCSLLGALTQGGVRAATGAESASPPAACGCAEEFDQLVEKTEADYVGFHQLLPTLDRHAYDDLVRTLRAAAAKADDDHCFEPLERYLDFFHDPHLFLSEQPQPSEEEKARLAAAAESTSWSEATVRAYLDANAGKLDAVEGIWYSDSARFAIVRQDPPRPGRDFVAVLLSNGVDNWRAGQVKAEIAARPDGSYDARYYYGDHTPHHLHGTIYRGLLLRLAPVFWGREYPVRAGDAGAIDPANPRNPTLRVLADGTVVLAVPSADGSYGDALERLTTEHVAELSKAPLVVLDLRGNEGGSSTTLLGLAPLYASPHQRPRPGYSGKEIVVSSPDLIRYYQDVEARQEPGSFYARRFAALVERMKREPGKVIATDIWGHGDPSALPPKAEPLGPGTAPFAILMDRGTVSAAEAFILSAWTSDRVTLFGDNSGGSIDYESVALGPMPCRRHGFLLGYPTAGASEHLPAGGFNAAGIPPDVRIPAGAADPIALIRAHYAGAAHR